MQIQNIQEIKQYVMHIGHYNIQYNYTMANQQLIATEEQSNLGITITRDLKWQKESEKSCKNSKIRNLYIHVYYS